MADGWVAERHDRRVEAARLSALQENVQATLFELNKARDDAVAVAAALRVLISFPQHDHGNDAVEELLRPALLYVPTFYPEINVYDDLKSSGELALLTNSELRSSLANMDARLGLVRMAQDDMATVQQLNIDSYMMDNLNLRWFCGSITGLDDIAEAAMPDPAFISDMDFQNLLLFKPDLVTSVEKEFQNAADALIAVQRSITSQLSTKTR